MFPISKKLYSAFFSVLILMGVIIAIGIFQILAINKSFENLIDNQVKKVLIAKDIAISVKERQVAGTSYLLTGEEEQFENFRSAQHHFDKTNNKFIEILHSKKEKEIQMNIEQLSNEFYMKMQSAFDFKKHNLSSEYNEIISNQTPEIVKNLKGQLDEFIQLQNNILKKSRQETEEKINSIIIWVLVLGAISIVVGTVVAIIISRLISRPVIQMSEKAEKIAAGDLTVEIVHVKNKDEIGELSHSFNEMTANLREVIRQVFHTSEKVTTFAEELTASAEETSKAANQITGSIQEMAVGSEKQVASVDESANAVQELSIGVQQIAERAHEVSGYMIETSEVATKGEKTVAEAIMQMAEINQTVSNLNEVVKALGSRSQQIGNIVEVITGIASQTNLLALNAAIEAARAGEVGRGFAVVADEVRKLAVQSADSANQISKLIQFIQKETENAVESMNDATQKVEKGIQVVDKTGEAFKQISASVEKVAAQIEEVSSSSQQMAAGTEQVVQSIQTISRIAEETALGTQMVSASSEKQLASMDEIATSATSLSRMAEELQTIIKKFKL